MTPVVTPALTGGLIKVEGDAEPKVAMVTPYSRLIFKNKVGNTKWLTALYNKGLEVMWYSLCYATTFLGIYRHGEER
jgi:hypothetical protein